MAKYYVVVFMGNPHYVTEEKLYDHVTHDVLVGELAIFKEKRMAELRCACCISDVWPERFWEIVEVEV